MKPRRCLYALLWTILLSPVFVSCGHPATERISLALFEENYVEVSIVLEGNSQGSTVLSATFIPPEGYHLYSKDIPITGIDGLGRPTLLELTSNSAMKTNGALVESVKAKVPDFGPGDLLVYPAGVVTLSLPVRLPPGNDWTEDELQVTYMACSASQCKPPVIAKHVLVSIPGADMPNNE